MTQHTIATRRAVLAALREGKSTRQAAWANGVCQGTAVRWAREYGILFESIRPLTIEQKQARLADLHLSPREFQLKYKLSRTQYYRWKRSVY